MSVVIVEGEKDSDAGAKIGLPTTTAGGVNSWRSDHAETIRGRHAAIVADSDEPGRIDAQKIAASLFGKAASVKVLELPEAKDLAEAIEKGTTRDALLALFQNTAEWRLAGGAEILNQTRAYILRFVALSPSQATAITLWGAHVHAFEAADSTAYLDINSAEKQSGKTRLLEVIRPVVPNPWLTGRVTAAVLTRKIDAVQPTLLLDESDTAFGAEKEYAEALRGV